MLTELKTRRWAWSLLPSSPGAYWIILSTQYFDREKLHKDLIYPNTNIENWKKPNPRLNQTQTMNPRFILDIQFAPAHSLFKAKSYNLETYQYYSHRFVELLCEDNAFAFETATSL